MATTLQLEGFLDSVEFVSAPDGSDEITMVGWALSGHGGIQTFVVTINKGLPTELRERAQYGLARADVPARLSRRAPGFELRIQSFVSCAEFRPRED